MRLRVCTSFGREDNRRVVVLVARVDLRAGVDQRFGEIRQVERGREVQRRLLAVIRVALVDVGRLLDQVQRERLVAGGDRRHEHGVLPAVDAQTLEERLHPRVAVLGRVARRQQVFALLRHLCEFVHASRQNMGKEVRTLRTVNTLGGSSFDSAGPGPVQHESNEHPTATFLRALLGVRLNTLLPSPTRATPRFAYPTDRAAERKPHLS